MVDQTVMWMPRSGRSRFRKDIWHFGRLQKHHSQQSCTCLWLCHLLRWLSFLRVCNMSPNCFPDHFVLLKFLCLCHMHSVICFFDICKYIKSFDAYSVDDLCPMWRKVHLLKYVPHCMQLPFPTAFSLFDGNKESQRANCMEFSHQYITEPPDIPISEA